MIPNLQHPVLVTIEQVDRGTAEQDDDFREPVQGTTYKAPKTCQGQIKWGSGGALDITRLGTQDDSDGYVTFRTADLRQLSIVLHIGDRFTKFGVGPNQVTHQVYITRLAPFGHYPDTGGAALIKAYFQDRQPARGTGG